MISSINYCVRVLVLLGAALLCVCGCSAVPGPAADSGTAANTDAALDSIAVLPVVNFGNTTAPLAAIDRQWADVLRKKGLPILEADAIEDIINRNRIRYIGGLDSHTAQIFKTQASAQAVLITILEYYNAVPPPKIALNARLVSTTRPPRIMWIDGTGMAGDDAPGLLDLDLIQDPAALTAKALDYLAESLTRYIAAKKIPARRPAARKIFGPQMTFQSMSLNPDAIYRVAIVPFFNLSDRNRAGDFMALTFARALSAYDNIKVVEPGAVRRQLLDLRIIMPSGISLAYADLVFDRLGADLIVNGEVLDYQDYQGLTGSPRVDFSAQIIERKSREVVWTVKSQNSGDDGILLFGRGKTTTAHELARQMVAQALAGLTH